MAPQQITLLRNNNDDGDDTIYLQKSTTDVNNNDAKKKCKYADKDKHDLTMILIRIGILIFCIVIYICSDVIQKCIISTWFWISRQNWFQSVYFETFLVIVLSFPIYIPIWLMDWFKVGEKYRINGKGGRFESESLPELLEHSIGYFLPLGILDTFHVKHYYGVPDDVIIEKRQNWIQTTRAFPEAPPKLLDMIIHIVVALVVFDLLFFLIHFTLHKNATLYRVFHKIHHTHTNVNAKVTDRLQPLERIALVLSANAGLKIQGAHPLTRVVFVFVFLYILADNHTGYEFPYNYDKIIPFNIIAGSRRHYEHHEYGTRYYQPIFRYADMLLEWHSKRKQC